MEGQAQIASTKLSGKARGPGRHRCTTVGPEHLCPVGVAYLATTTTERGVVMFVAGVLCVTAVQLVLAIRDRLS